MGIGEGGNDNFQRSNPLDGCAGREAVPREAKEKSGNYPRDKLYKYDPTGDGKSRKIRRSKRRSVNSLLVFGDNSSSSSTLFVGDGDSGSNGTLQEMNLEDGKFILNFPVTLEVRTICKEDAAYYGEDGHVLGLQVNSLVEWRGYLVSGLWVEKEEGMSSGNITVWDTKSRSIVTQWNTESPVCSLLSLKKKVINGEEDDYLCSGHR